MTENIKLLRRNDLVYPTLSYQIVGILFDAYNKLGFGLHEKNYQKAIAQGLMISRLKFQEQVPVKVYFEGKFIGIYYLDFLVENKIILELKKCERFSRKNIEQVLAYLKATKLKLGLIVNFTRSGVKFKRILNI
jgi:GxxExxY protein